MNLKINNKGVICRMKWNPEMESQWKDLSVIGILVKEKQTVKGNFQDGLFIKEKRVEFEKVSICEGRILAYLPLERERKERYGRKFVCPDMEQYEEFVCGEGNYGIAFEVCPQSQGKKTEISVKELAEDFIDEVQEKYEDTVVGLVNIFQGKRILCSLVAEGEMDNKTVFSYIYFIKGETNLFRCYIFCEKSNWKEMSYLAAKIVKNIETIDGAG